MSPAPVREIAACRACGNRSLRGLLDLGPMALTGVFPRSPGAPPLTRGPLALVQCDRASRPEACGLVQLRHSYDPRELYGATYGYRSSLNRSMVEHLHGLAERLRRLVPLGRDDLVLDIGSNDGTLLAGFPPEGPLLVGIDPAADTFRRHYRADIRSEPDFFSADRFRARFPGRAARLVTSIAMFYDLERPVAFMQEVRDILADDGLWCFEQSYLPAMIRRNAYDTICHEHLEYYALRPILWMARQAGLAIVDVSQSAVNGGSFAVVAAKEGAGRRPEPAVAALLEEESRLGPDDPRAFEEFRARIEARRKALLDRLDGIRARGETVLGYGASTKGNVLLQYCGIGPARLPCIAEVNEDKIGCHTPGTAIPIVSEAEARARRPDYFLVLPWHFRDAIVKREQEFLRGGGRLIFPLPDVEVVSA